MDEKLHQMFHKVFVAKNISVEYMSRVSCLQKTLESFEREKACFCARNFLTLCISGARGNLYLIMQENSRQMSLFSTMHN